MLSLRDPAAMLSLRDPEESITMLSLRDPAAMLSLRDPEENAAMMMDLKEAPMPMMKLRDPEENAMPLMDLKEAPMPMLSLRDPEENAAMMMDLKEAPMPMMKLRDPEENALIPLIEVEEASTPMLELQELEPENDTECSLCKTIASAAELFIKVDKLNETQVMDALKAMCAAMPSKLQPECKLFVDTFGKKIVEMIFAGDTPDEICVTLKFCPKSDDDDVTERRQIDITF